MSTPARQPEKPLLSETEFVAGFHAIGAERYHHKHPFHLLMHEGKLTRGQLQAWALNRYYYQQAIPLKDAAILARSEDPAFRLAWRKRILDHDGDGTKPGGHRKVAKACRSHRIGSQAGVAWARDSPCYAICGASLRGFCFHSFASRSCRIFSHGTFQPPSSSPCAWTGCASTIRGFRVVSTISPARLDASPRRRRICIGVLCEKRADA